MKYTTPLGIDVETIVWAIPGEGVTLDQLLARMKELGNTVLEVDVENNRLLLVHEKE